MAAEEKAPEVEEQEETTEEVGAPQVRRVKALKDERWLGVGIRVSEPDEEGHVEVAFILDDYLIHTYIITEDAADYAEDVLASRHTDAPEQPDIAVASPADVSAITKP